MNSLSVDLISALPKSSDEDSLELTNAPHIRTFMAIPVATTDAALHIPNGFIRVWDARGIPYIAFVSSLNHQSLFPNSPNKNEARTQRRIFINALKDAFPDAIVFTVVHVGPDYEYGI